MHMLPKYRALFLHAYKPHTCGQPCVTQQCIPPHGVPHHRAYFMLDKEKVKKISKAFGRTLVGRGVRHGLCWKGVDDARLVGAMAAKYKASRWSRWCRGGGGLGRCGYSGGGEGSRRFFLSRPGVSDSPKPPPALFPIWRNSNHAHHSMYV